MPVGATDKTFELDQEIETFERSGSGGMHICKAQTDLAQSP